MARKPKPAKKTGVNRKKDPLLSVGSVNTPAMAIPASDPRLAAAAGEGQFSGQVPAVGVTSTEGGSAVDRVRKALGVKTQVQSTGAGGEGQQPKGWNPWPLILGAVAVAVARWALGLGWLWAALVGVLVFVLMAWLAGKGRGE